MNYKQIINKLEEENQLIEYDNKDINFSYITYNSKEVKDKTLFICKGTSFKKEYLQEAIKKGATAYISNKDYNVDIPKIIVKDERISLAVIANLFYPDNLYKIGLTGTKGKTTTNYFLHNILKNHLHYKPGIFATHYFYTGKTSGPTHLTTPESLELHKYLHEMQEQHIKYVTMEVSSQAEYHKRDYGMTFNLGAFLNIGEDHISPLEHKNFEEYLSCKIEFLKKCQTIILFKQTDHYNTIYNSIKDKNIITYGYTNDCDYQIKNITKNKNLTFDVEHEGKTENYHINIPGRFNIENATCAIVISKILKVKKQDIQKGLEETIIPGRMNIIDNDKFPIIIDYAHNELSTEKVYETLKKDYPDKKIKVVFGATGDKGATRKKGMGILAGKYADYVYLTEDDPGNHKAIDICNDIAEHIKKYHNNYEIIEDRETAIRTAVKNLTENDVLAILGKGDEDFIIIGNDYKPYKTDMKIAQDELNKRKDQ